MENVKHKPCLVLNQDWKPLTVINWKRAICLGIVGEEVVGEGVRIVEWYSDDSVKSSGGKFIQVPAVAVSNRYVKKRRKIKIKKKNLLVRDNGKCQYCEKELDNREATIDHVIPKSRFTSKKYSHHWENIVISCRRCNAKKGNRTPSEAGMKLLSVPKKPNMAQFYSKSLISNSMPAEWKLYLK
jgi:5-methylcytosine-specific restriction endonuclease McrA